MKECCGHDRLKHVQYSAAYKDGYGNVLGIRDYVICIATRCRCERPPGLYTVTR